MIDLIIHIRDRNIVNMHELRTAFNSLKDGKHQVTIKDIRNRSLPQNDYYWVQKWATSEYKHISALSSDIQACVYEVEEYLFNGKRAPEKQLELSFGDEEEEGN